MTIKRNQLVLIGLFVIFFIFEISLWIATGGFPAMMEQTESYSTYRIGKNFFDHGIINLKFTDDCAISPSKEAHPYYYTHQPNFPNFIPYILMNLGIHSMPYHILIMIVIFGVALFYMYLTVREYTGSEQTALLVLAISVFSYSSVLIPGLNILRGWTWFVIFAPLYHFKKYASNGDKLHFFVGLIFYFLAMYYDYVIAFYFTLVFFLLKVFGFYKKLSWKRFLGYMLLGTIPPFLLHKILVIWAVGFDAFYQDFILTISNRVFGSSIWHEMKAKAFYASKGIVYSAGVGPTQSISSMVPLVMRYLGFLFGKFHLLIVVIFFFISGGILFLRKLKSAIFLKLLEFFEINNYELIKFFVVFFTPMILFAFIKYIVGYYFHGLLLPLVVFPVTMGMGVFLFLLFTNLSIAVKKQRERRLILFSVLIIFVVGQFIRTQYIHLTKTIPVKPMPGHKVLPKYKNHSFATNIAASYIYYFTGEWAKSLWTPISADYDEDKFVENTDFMLARDAFTNKEKYEHPDFLFMADLGLFPRIPKPEKVFRHYHLAEKGEDFWIFDLRRKNVSRRAKEYTEISDEQFKQLIASQKKLTPVDFYTNGIHSTSFPAKAAFDGDRKTMWHSPQAIGTLGWLAVKLAHPAKLRGLTVTIRDDLDTSQAPFEFTIEGSNDNQTWDHITEVVKLKWETAGETKKIGIESNNWSYLYYRFDFTVNAFAQWISIAEMELFGNQSETLGKQSETSN